MRLVRMEKMGICSSKTKGGTNMVSGERGELILNGEDVDT